jgi:hypothetical protein
MKLTDVAIVAVDGFSPFHYSVPCMLFGDSGLGNKRFNLQICAERPGLLTAPRRLCAVRQRRFHRPGAGGYRGGALLGRGRSASAAGAA